MQGGIYEIRTGRGLVCKVQSDLGVDTAFILCAPVFDRQDWTGPITAKLNIPIIRGEEPSLIIMSQMFAIPYTDLGALVGDASAHRDEIIAAVDLLVSGF